MIKTKMGKGSEYNPSEFWPSSFDPNNYGLAHLFSKAAIEIDDNIIGRNFGSRPARRLGKILYTAFSDDEMSDWLKSFYTRQIFSRVTGESINIEPDYKSIGLDLIKFKNLPEEKQKKLRDMCVSLSREFSIFWNSKNPNGFKHYAA